MKSFYETHFPDGLNMSGKVFRLLLTLLLYHYEIVHQFPPNWATTVDNVPIKA